MPQYRYDGPTHLFKISEDDPGTPRGKIGTFSAELVERMMNPKPGQMAHRFTPAKDLPADDIETAKEVEANPALPSTGTDGGADATRSVAAKNK